MKNKSIKLYVFVFALIVLDLCINVSAQQKAIDQPRMNRDLKIMEGIIDRLLQRENDGFNVNGQTRAIYLPEFGIVFYLKQGLFPYAVFDENLQKENQYYQETLKNYESALKVLEQKMRQQEMEIDAGMTNEFQAERLESDELDVEAFTEALSRYSEQMVQEEEEIIEKLKGEILLFFRNYASAIGQLQSQDRIVVLIDLSNWQSINSWNAILMGWISKQDVDRYRQGQIDESDFEGRVHFQFPDSESDIITDIGILLEILGRATDSSASWGSSSNIGTYIEGLGALIFIEVSRTFPFGIAMGNVYNYILNGERLFMRDENGRSIAYDINGQRIGEVITDSESTGIEENDYVENIQNELFELISSYGHTLRLEPEEWIVLNVNLGNQLIGLYDTEWASSFLIIKLKKKDIDDYYRGIITLDTLKNRSIQQTY